MDLSALLRAVLLGPGFINDQSDIPAGPDPLGTRFAQDNALAAAGKSMLPMPGTLGFLAEQAAGPVTDRTPMLPVPMPNMGSAQPMPSWPEGMPVPKSRGGMIAGTAEDLMRAASEALGGMTPQQQFLRQLDESMASFGPLSRALPMQAPLPPRRPR